MKIFVTGATGVLGRPVVKALVERGADVLALSRSDANRRDIEERSATPVSADLYDADSLAGCLAGCDAVLHLATSIPRASDMKKPDAWATNDRIREQGTRSLVDAALRAGSVRTFIYPSVFFMYGDAGERWQSARDASIKPVGLLNSTLEAEAEVARFAAAAPGNRGVSLRFGSFYGPTSRDSAGQLAMARKGRAIQLAPGHAYKSLIWIDDAVSAMLAALDRAPSGIFDVAEDDPFTQDQAIRALALAVGRRRLFRIPRILLQSVLGPDLRELLGRSQRVTSEEFKEATGWSPQVPDQSVGWRRIAAGANS